MDSKELAKLLKKEIINEIITLIHCFSMKHYSKRKISQLKELLLND